MVLYTVHTFVHADQCTAGTSISNIHCCTCDFKIRLVWTEEIHYVKQITFDCESNCENNLIMGDFCVHVK